MPYLNLDVDYFDHRKTRRLCALLGDEAAVYPLRLWAYAAKHHAKDGYLPGYSAAEIENLVHWKGEKGLLVGALVQIKFIKRYSTGFKINDWTDHEGHLAAFKERAVKAARSRWDKIAGRSNASSNAQASPKQSPIPYLAVPPIPNQAIPSKEAHDMRSAGASETSTALDRELAAVGYPKPDPQKDPERALACAYREIRKIPKATWNTWDAQHLDEFRPYLRTIIDNCGSLARAYDCMVEIIDYFESETPTKKRFAHWTIRGVAKESYQWAADHPQKENSNGRYDADRKGVSVSSARSKTERGFNSFRSDAPSSPSLPSGIRNHSDVQPGNGTDHGREETSDDRDDSELRKDSLEGQDPPLQSGESEADQ